MRPANPSGRSILAVVLGGVAALVAFGLLAALAWVIPASGNSTYKTTTLIVGTALSLVAGGYLSATLAGRDRVRYGLALGAIVGTVGFGYVLGLNWTLAVAIPLSAGMGALGGWLATWQRPRNGAS